MATTPVVMKIQDYKDREVQMVSYEFDQETDREGQMTGIPRFQMLRVRVKALNDGTPELMAWMCDRFLKKDGEIQFLETKTLKVMKTIKFTGAYCVDFEENWADKEGHYEEILISCQNIEVGSVKFENAWAHIVKSLIGLKLRKEIYYGRECNTGCAEG